MKGLDKLKQAGTKATKKLPKPLRKKADRKLGLFIHKYVATLYYFDDEIQEIYWEMEEQAEKGYYFNSENGEKTVQQLSEEMKFVIQTKNSDDYKGKDKRKHQKMSKKISKKMSQQAEKIEDISEKNPKKLFKKVKDLMKMDEMKEEDVKQEFDLDE